MKPSISMKDKIVVTMTQVDRPMHIKEIAEDFLGIPESTIRGRINENIGTLFQRIGKGIYTLRGDKGTIALINADARNLDECFEENSIDLLIADHPWEDEKSHTGRNKCFAQGYETFKYSEEDFKQKFNALKEGGFLVEFLPEKNTNNKEYLREIEDLAEEAGFSYFAEVNITGGNSNIGRKKKYISTAFFFTKGDARKMKLWDEKINKMVKQGEFTYLKKEYLTDFKKVYTEVMTPPEGMTNTMISISPSRQATNFDIRITREEAIELIHLKEDGYIKYTFDIMCKEYGDDEDWQEVNSDDLDEWENIGERTLTDDLQTFEVYFTPPSIQREKEESDFKYYLLYFGSKNLLRENFQKHLSRSMLPSFKKIQKEINIGHELYKKRGKLDYGHEDMIQRDSIKNIERNFYMAFNEYMEFLTAQDSYKMGTRTILPEFFIGDNIKKSEKFHESQKPQNTLEDIILQTSRKGELVVEQFAGSYIGAEACISLGNEGKGWRDYIGLELDSERVKSAKARLRIKYPNTKILTKDDLYLIYTPGDRSLIESSEGNIALKKLSVLENRINTDLVGILKVEVIIEPEAGLEAKDFKDGNSTIVKINFDSSKKLASKNMTLHIVPDHNLNLFLILNQENKIINKTSSGAKLDESLMKLYTSFL